MLADPCYPNVGTDKRQEGSDLSPICYPQDLLILRDKNFNIKAKL